jgi:glyceraldehyde 3-phosphate dehydrogenase
MYHRKVKAGTKKGIKLDDCRGHIEIEGVVYPILSQKEPEKLPWKELKVDIVIESTGFFTKHKDAKKHLKAGAKKVVISAPSKDDQTQTHILSVNTNDGIKEDIVSNASCTTNSLSPAITIINNAFGVQKAMMTTIHSYTADQNIVDGPHRDLRRARAAAQNIIPTTTGAAVATTKTIPELGKKFDGIAIRVPTIVGSISDITMLIKKDATVEEVNDAFREASSKSPFKGIVDVTDEPIVSSDIIGNSHSAIIDLSFTRVVDKNLLKVLAWYDNEWGYANRLVEMVQILIV